MLCSAPRRTTARARCVHRSRRRTGAGQTVRVRVVRSESVGFPCTPAAVALSFVAPAGAAARQRRCRLFIPLFARLRMSWSDSDEDDRVRTATAHDRSRRRTYPYAVGRGSDCSTQGGLPEMISNGSGSLHACAVRDLRPCTNRTSGVALVPIRSITGSAPLMMAPGPGQTRMNA